MCSVDTRTGRILYHYNGQSKLLSYTIHWAQEFPRHCWGRILNRTFAWHGGIRSF